MMNKLFFHYIMTPKKYYILVSILIQLIFINCARVGRPTGGPKDQNPPITLRAVPDFNSLNFNSKSIVISFDEYIKLKDINEQLVISPPLKYPPEISPIGIASKQIRIKIKDTLQQNTTYSFNFGNAIIDNSEGNILERFSYVFSTGSYIDSLSISGHVKNAFSDNAPEDTSILLYRIDSIYSDSIVYKKRPDFVSNTLTETGFTVSNLKAGTYQLIALSDKNKNLKFDPKDDKIGFATQPIQIPTDSSFTLSLFKEKPDFLIKKISELSCRHLIAGYEGSLQTEIDSIIDKTGNSISFHYYKDIKSDSLHIWHHRIETDTLYVSFKEKDTSYHIPIRLRLKDKDSINISSLTKRILHLNDTLTFSSSTPIKHINTSLISVKDKDSMRLAYSPRLAQSKMRFSFDFKKEENQSYHVSILPGALEDMYSQLNDSLSVDYKTKSLEDYGDISIELDNKTNNSVLVELLNLKNEVIRTKYCTASKTINYNTLEPGKYKIRLITDINGNKRWDAGNFLLRQQPEPVAYFKKEINLKANWNIIEKITIK